MKQFLLAAALIAVPAAGFSTFQVYVARANAATNAPAASLGDLSAFAGIVTDVQGIAAKGDLTGAKTRIKDFEIAWDRGEKGLKPLDPDHWHMIDEAADSALTAIRADNPNPQAVGDALTALQASLVANPVVTK
ncbi:MAG TPA: hypothetical protein PLI43_16025 [Albidovulum sp.]|uniref:hypothetical protein n=1 Tax=Albidovulum sp. TaxID=1872424 RepID=UPI002CF057AA|nr:hypothetical protein [Albidovulum sp.]